jgi:hypothetical protein
VRYLILLNIIISFINNIPRCRHLTLAIYFGDKNAEICNGCKTQCDYCKNPSAVQKQLNEYDTSRLVRKQNGGLRRVVDDDEPLYGDGRNGADRCVCVRVKQ